MVTPGYKDVFTEETLKALFPRSGVVTDAVKRDIIQFFSSAHTSNRSISTTDVMNYFDCSRDSARRAITGLVDQGVLVKVGIDQYKVSV